MSVSMLASTTTLLVETKEFMTGSVMGCNAEGSTMLQSPLSLILAVAADKTASEDGVKGKLDSDADGGGGLDAFSSG